MSQITRSEHLRDLKRRLAEQREMAARALSSIRGLEAEIDALEGGKTPESGLVELSRTDAIVEILRRSDRHMSPVDIRDALRSEGRTEELNSVTATLTYLLKDRRVVRTDRKYTAF